jgi:hypothetical protein
VLKVLQELLDQAVKMEHLVLMELKALQELLV